MNFYKKHKHSCNVFLVYNIIIIIVVGLLYFTIPLILNYLPESINTQFDIMMSSVSYNVQIIAIMLAIMLVSNITVAILLGNVIKLEKYMAEGKLEEQKELLDKARKDSYKVPYVIFLIQLPLGVLITALILLVTNSHDWIMIIKIFLLILSFDVLASVTTFIFSRKAFTSLLLELPYDEENKWRKVSLKTRLLIITLPILLVALFFTSLVGYSRIAQEKGNILHDAYKIEIQNILENKKIKSIKEYETFLQQINLINENDNRVVIYSDKTYKSIDNKPISNFIIEYTLQISEKYDGQVMDSYGKDVQGIMRKVYCEEDGSYCYIGVIYDISARSALGFLLMSSFLFFLLNYIVLNSVSEDITNSINFVVKKLLEIAQSKYNIAEATEKMKIVSNDEIGELIMAFNKIQDLTKEYINEIHNNQETLMESDRLASLGQLIGGIAHNLKTPIMSISGNLQGLQDLILEYKTSIGDPEVTEEDNKDIAKDMQELVDKTRIHLSYMSDIITVVKGQAVQTNEKQIFSAADVLQRIDILMKHNLKKALVELRIEIDEDAKTAYLKGDINGLVQVIDNCIQNAIQSYGEKTNQFIDLKITKQEESICFAIIDYGCGIPKEVQEKLFKEMITTKGKNGTGLGLYMSHSLIKGNFKGDFRFESEVGKGTTFYIIIPISQ